MTFLMGIIYLDWGTSGKVFLREVADERFCVCNSGG